MLFKAQIAVLVVSLFIVAVRCESESLLPLVTGGIVTVPGEAPFVVSIRRQAAIGQPNNFYCSGTIVNPNHVVTATACVHDTTFHLINPFWFRIIAGDLNIVNPSFQRFETRATHIYTHPNYAFNPPRNSVAVMRTLGSFPMPSNNIDIAVRNSIPLPVNHNCRFIGWGAQTDTGTILATQRRVDAPILDQCGGASIDTENMFCAGSLAASNGVCTGNLGGGLFCSVNGWWEFTGILAGGIGCGIANTPGQYMRVRNFDTWITQQFTRNDPTNPGILVQVPPPA